MKKELIDYFNSTVDQIKTKLNIDVLIKIEDYSDDCCEIGRCYKFNDGHYEISIDSYFLEQSYDYEVNGVKWALDLIHGETLLKCLCHEIAHMKYWNHTKWHRQYTEELIKMCS